MNNQICFMFGNRDTPPEAREFIEGSVELHIVDDGVTEFIVGQYGNFDRMAASVVMEMKQKYPHVRLTLLTPYYPTEVPEGFDGSIFPEGLEYIPKQIAIVAANHYMIDHADYVICYVTHNGNALLLYGRAERRAEKGELRIEELHSAGEWIKRYLNDC